MIPEEVAYGRIVEALKRCQKTVFGDTEETAWCLLVLGGVITMRRMKAGSQGGPR